MDFSEIQSDIKRDKKRRLEVAPPFDLTSTMGDVPAGSTHKRISGYGQFDRELRPLGKAASSKAKTDEEVKYVYRASEVVKINNMRSQLVLEGNIGSLTKTWAPNSSEALDDVNRYTLVDLRGPVDQQLVDLNLNVAKRQKLNPGGLDLNGGPTTDGSYQQFAEAVRGAPLQPSNSFPDSTKATAVWSYIKKLTPNIASDQQGQGTSGGDASAVVIDLVGDSDAVSMQWFSKEVEQLAKELHEKARHFWLAYSKRFVTAECMKKAEDIKADLQSKTGLRHRLFEKRQKSLHSNAQVMLLQPLIDIVEKVFKAPMDRSAEVNVKPVEKQSVFGKAMRI